MYLDTRDLQEQIDNLESEIEDLNEELEELEKDIASCGSDFELLTVQDQIEKGKEQLQDLRDELQPLLDLKSEGIPDWDYGATLISADNWEDYVEDLVKDCGYIPNDVPWWIVIDWAATADNVAADYSTVDYDGDTYYYSNC